MARFLEGVNDFLASGDWAACMAAVDRQRAEDADCWECAWIEARVLRFRDADYQGAFAAVEQGIGRFGYRFPLLDAGMSYLNLAGRCAELLAFWQRHQASWSAGRELPAQIAMHLAHAYSQLKRPQDGLDQIRGLGLLGGPEQDRALCGSHFTYYYNVSCLQAETGDLEQMLVYAQAALSCQDKLAPFLSDGSFAALRDEALFKDFIHYNQEHFHSYACLEKDGHRVELYCHPNQNYALAIVEHHADGYRMRVWELTDAAVATAQQFRSRAQLLVFRHRQLQELRGQGYSEIDYPYLDEWCAALAPVFSRSAAIELPPAAAKPVFCLEWDYVFYDLPADEHPLTRGYYYYGDLGENADLATLPRIPNRSVFERIMRKSLAAAPAAGPGAILSCVHAEHDSGEEFSYEHRSCQDLAAGS